MAVTNIVLPSHWHRAGAIQRDGATPGWSIWLCLCLSRAARGTLWSEVVGPRVHYACAPREQYAWAIGRFRGLELRASSFELRASGAEPGGGIVDRAPVMSMVETRGKGRGRGDGQSLLRCGRRQGWKSRGRAGMQWMIDGWVAGRLDGTRETGGCGGGHLTPETSSRLCRCSRHSDARGRRAETGRTDAAPWSWGRRDRD